MEQKKKFTIIQTANIIALRRRKDPKPCMRETIFKIGYRWRLKTSAGT